jgi:hypothetical protein
MPLNISQEERLRRAERARYARKFVDPAKQAAAAREVGLLNEGASPEICSLGGSTSRDLGVGVHAMTPRELSVVGTRGGKIGGPIQGRENARIGWLRHIALLRYEKSHADCEYCIHNKPPKEST